MNKKINFIKGLLLGCLMPLWIGSFVIGQINQDEWYEMPIILTFSIWFTVGAIYTISLATELGD